MSQPFLQLYVGDYIRDTMDLSTEEHGAYLLLLMTMWSHDARLPNDPKKLARIARLSPAKFKRVWGSIGRFFDDDGEVITQKRLTKEHQKAKEKSQKRAYAGAKGGAAKSLKYNNTDVAKATVLPKHLPEPEPDKKEDTNVSSQKRRKRSQLPDGWRLPSDWGEWAVGKGMDELSVRREAEQFANHHQAKGSLMLDWRKAWQTWVNNAIKWQGEREKSRNGGKPEPGQRRTLPDGRTQYYVNHSEGWMNEVC